MNKTTALLLAAALACAVQLASASDITGTVTFKGTAPKEFDMTPLMADVTCAKLHSTMPTTRFYVLGPNNELADAVVFLDGIKGQSTGATAKPVVLDQKGCLYVPQILAVQTGQKLVVENSDPVMHNVHTVPTADSGNEEMNQAQLPGAADLTFTFPKAEMFLKVKCDVHQWMFAWVSVFDHPYFAVTAKDGTFKIPNVPPGNYTLKVMHRKAGKATQEIEVKEGVPCKVDFTLPAK